MRFAPLIVVAFLVLAACAGGERRPGEPRWIPATHSVQKGETLYGISWQYGLDYRLVADWNSIGAPHRIHPGQRLRLYPPAGREHESTLAQRDTSATGVGGRAGDTRASAPSSPNLPAPGPQGTVPRGSPSASPSVSQAPAPQPRRTPPAAVSRPSAGAVVWQWPLKGELLSNYSNTSSGRRGVRIAGNPGQPVYAAAQGRVVYSGGGLIGYGRLVILKHNDTFLSAYAHNRTLLVQEGESVKAGQQIAEVGSTGATERALLYFEIRQDGQPVDPLLHLPRRL